MATMKKKTIVTPGTKVSQKTIDDIKKLGMTKALALAGKNGKTAGGLASEFQEGVRRMYGAKRLEAAKAQYAPKTKPAAKPATKATTKPTAKPTAAQLAVASARAGMKVTATKPATKPTVKPKTKTGSSMADKAKVVGGTAAAIGLLALGKGKGAGAAAKLSPAVGKFAKSGVGKALFGTGEKISTKAFSTAGRVTAKAGKPVSQTQYEAMQAAAKAKGIKLPTAAKATATKVKPKAKLTKAGAIATTGAGNKNK